jgi:hypothetical protein
MNLFERLELIEEKLDLLLALQEGPKARKKKKEKILPTKEEVEADVLEFLNSTWRTTSIPVDASAISRKFGRVLGSIELTVSDLDLPDFVVFNKITGAKSYIPQKAYDEFNREQIEYWQCYGISDAIRTRWLKARENAPAGQIPAINPPSKKIIEEEFKDIFNAKPPRK